MLKIRRRLREKLVCLRTLFQQRRQQQYVQQLQAPTHSHSNSRDLDSHFANLSQHSDPRSGATLSLAFALRFLCFSFGFLSFSKLVAPFMPLFMVVSGIKRGAAPVNREFHPMENKARKVNNCGSGP